MFVSKVRQGRGKVSGNWQLMGAGICLLCLSSGRYRKMPPVEPLKSSFLKDSGKDGSSLILYIGSQL